MLKPVLLRHLLDRDGAPVACVDADIRFYDDIDEIARLSESEGVMLTSHGGFVALAPGDDAERLIDWWRGRLGFDLDQLRLGRVTAAYCRRSGCERGVLEPRRAGRSSATVTTTPLVDTRCGSFTSAGSTRRGRTPSPAVRRGSGCRTSLSLAALCEEYATDLRDAGFDPERPPRWTYDELTDGTTLTPTLRRLYRQGERDRAFSVSPFTEAGRAEFAAWCEGPADRGAAHGLTRAALAVHEARADLQAAFPDLDGDDGPRFFWWISHHRQDAADLGLPPEWIPAPAPGSEEEPPVEEGAPWGVNVAGYLRSELGVGEAARAVITGWTRAGIPLMPVHGSYVPRSRQGHDFAFLDPDAAPFPVNLICVNADELPEFLAGCRARLLGGPLHDRLLVVGGDEHSRSAPWAHLDLVDEVWVGSEHVAARAAAGEQGPDRHGADPGDDAADRPLLPRAAGSTRRVTCSCSCSISTA